MWQPVTLFLPFTSCQPQRVKSKQQRGAWQTFNKWDSCLKNTDTHRGTLWRTNCCQAWKPSSQLSGSNDSSLAAWVKSLNVSLTSCSHTAPTSAFYIMYFWSSLHPSQFSCIPFIPSLETICCSERDAVGVTWKKKISTVKQTKQRNKTVQLAKILLLISHHQKQNDFACVFLVKQL